MVRQRLMGLARKYTNRALTHDMTDEELSGATKRLWGHDDKPKGAKGTGENEWYTPAKYVEIAAVTNRYPI